MKYLLTIFSSLLLWTISYGQIDTAKNLSQKVLLSALRISKVKVYQQNSSLGKVVNAEYLLGKKGNTIKYTGYNNGIFSFSRSFEFDSLENLIKQETWYDIQGGNKQIESYDANGNNTFFESHHNGIKNSEVKQQFDMSGRLVETITLFPKDEFARTVQLFDSSGIYFMSITYDSIGIEKSRFDPNVPDELGGFNNTIPPSPYDIFESDTTFNNKGLIEKIVQNYIDLNSKFIYSYVYNLNNEIIKYTYETINNGNLDFINEYLYQYNYENLLISLTVLENGEELNKFLYEYVKE